MSIYRGIDGEKLYTEEELQDKIIIAVTKNSLTFEEVIKLIKTKLETMYTEEELQEALKAKKEECALICDKLEELVPYTVYQSGADPYDIGLANGYVKCAEAIRSKEWRYHQLVFHGYVLA